MTELICIVCPKGCHLSVDEEKEYTVKGAGCPRGVEYGKNELQNPTRVLTSTVRFEGADGNRLPVKSDGVIPKRLMMVAAESLNGVLVKGPIRTGDIIIEDLCGTGVPLVATRTME